MKLLDKVLKKFKTETVLEASIKDAEKRKKDVSSLIEDIDKKLLKDPDNEDLWKRKQKLSEEYSQRVKDIATLEDAAKKNKVDANTKALIAANIAGIIIILTYESTRVIATKAFNYVIKPKV